MHHPNETDLALYAGNDLGRLARLRVDWHLRSCGKCQQEVTEFSSLRAETRSSTAEPHVNWDRLAAEMKANIRLGLEAGECIAPLQPRGRGNSPWAWAAMATAALIAIAAGGEMWINHPWSATAPGKTELSGMTLPDDAVLEAKESGIQMRDGDSVVSQLQNDSRGGVVNSVNAQGSVAASYVDSKTGTVTVQTIYDGIYYGQ